MPWNADQPLPVYNFKGFLLAMKLAIMRWARVVRCSLGHAPNWCQICTRCKRPLKAGVFYEPQSLGRKTKKTVMVEIYPEEVAKGSRFQYLKPMARRRNTERDELIYRLFKEHGNKSRVARAVGLSVTAVAKALKRVELINSEEVDGSGTQVMM